MVQHLKPLEDSFSSLSPLPVFPINSHFHSFLVHSFCACHHKHDDKKVAHYTYFCTLLFFSLTNTYWKSLEQQQKKSSLIFFRVTYSIAWMFHSLFNQSAKDEHLGCSLIFFIATSSQWKLLCICCFIYMEAYFQSSFLEMPLPGQGVDVYIFLLRVAKFSSV